jgi:hypothetical protein
MRAITNRQEIARAYQQFARAISAGGVPVHRLVGYKGANEPADLLWHADLHLWVLLEPDRIDNRYWCAFGVDDPNPASMLSITCEINPPKDGIYRRCAGLFVEDHNGNIYLAHSGKVGGGRAGIGKAAFLGHWGNTDVTSVRFPDGTDHDYIILGRLDDPSLRQRLAAFVQAVSQFKQATVTGTQTEEVAPTRYPTRASYFLRPTFSTMR